MTIITTLNGEYAPVVLDANGNLPVAMAAGTASIGKLGANSGVDIGDVTINNASTAPVYTEGRNSSSVPLAYRSAVVAADVIAAVGTVTCTKLTGVGALLADTYYVYVVAINAYGRGVGKAGNTTVTTETTNLGVRAAFAQVTGATHYDIYCTTAASPLWCGRITEAQRASGIIIDAVGSTAAGGTAGAVDIYPIGTGLAVNTTAVVNTAYVVPASPVVATGYQYVDFMISCTRTGDAVAPVLVVIPAVLNSRTSTYFFPVGATTLAFGGTAGAYGPMKQKIQVAVRGEEAIVLLVQQIAGTGMSVDIDYVLS